MMTSHNITTKVSCLLSGIAITTDTISGGGCVVVVVCMQPVGVMAMEVSEMPQSA
mgnify:CR=1 FL=1